MKTTPLIVLALGSVGLVGACAASKPIPPATMKLSARTTAADAVNQIAAAKCAYDERCKNSDVIHNASCVTATKTDIDRDFGGDKNCENGVNVDDLDQCVAKLRGQECGLIGVVAEGIQTSMACGSSDLCLQ
jgi:hypothetical protein